MGGKLCNRKKRAFLTRQADRPDKQPNRRKGPESQRFAAEGPEITQHQGSFLLKIHHLGGTVQRREQGKGGDKDLFQAKPPNYSCNEKKDSDQGSSKPMLEVPVLGARYVCALMPFLGEGVRRHSINGSDTGSQVEDIQQTHLTSRINIYPPQHQGIPIC